MALDVPPGYRRPQGSRCRRLSGGRPGGCGQPGRPDHGLAGPRGGRRQSQSRLRGRRRQRAAWCSSRRCPMSGWSARAGRCRSRRAFFEHQALTAQATVAPAHVPEALSFRRDPGAHRDGLPQPAHHPAQGPDPRHRSIPRSPTTWRPSWPRRCSRPPTSASPPPPRRSTWRCSATIPSCAGSPRIWSSPIRGAWPRPTAGPARSSTSTAAAVRADGAVEAGGTGATS